MKLGTAQVIRADSRHLPLADNSVDLVVTSPPYFALRSYQDGGEHYEGQVGSEATPAEFVDALLEVTRECVRVLKPSGSLWVNLGDKYAGSSNGTLAHRAASRDRTARASGGNTTGVATKSLLGLPWRYALRCIDDLGLILRAEVIWAKPNGLPESVTDRVRRSHEQWFHFTLEPRYFSAVDEIRERHITHDAVTRIRTSDYDGPMSGAMNGAGNPLGKLPGSVWTVPTEPLRVPDHLGIDHFAAFPTEWPRRIIQGWSPTHITEESWTTDSTASPGPAADTSPSADAVGGASTTESKPTQSQSTPPTRPAVVLDPFGGTGTTAMVAKALGRHGISVDMSADYCRLAQWRTNDRNQLAKVLGIEKAEPAHEGEQSLLDLIDGGAA